MSNILKEASQNAENYAILYHDVSKSAIVLP